MSTNGQIAVFAGLPVTVTRGGRNGYPVHGTVELMYFSAVFTDGPAPAAVIRVTRTAGLYQQGDLFIARLAELEPGGGHDGA